MASTSTRSASIAVLVAALGYFVDIYDLVLFGVVRQVSLADIGVTAPDAGVKLLNWQMGGMLIGGILWGILGDKRGRRSVLFGSILLYSAANIANATVTSFDAYALWRFLAGVGLAGELGAGITLVSEVMRKEHRGYGTMIVAAVGLCGAVVAAEVGGLFEWRTAYVVGGVMGLLLLFLRIGTFESGMFEQLKSRSVGRGDLRVLFKDRRTALRYVSVIVIAIPIWYVVGVLVMLSPEISTALRIEGKVVAGEAIKYCYIGLAIGDVASGALSQWVGSRKKIVLLFLVLTVLTCALYFQFGARSVATFYTVCGAMGFASGYWAVFMTLAAEQFGTNIRATVTTTAPNFVRGSVVLLTLCFETLRTPLGVTDAAITTGVITLALAFLALIPLRETFGRDLDFVEEGQLS